MKKGGIRAIKKHPMHINNNTRIRWEVIRSLPEIKDLSNKRVLDIGSGLGYFSLQFTGLGADVLAVDVDIMSLDFISENYGINTQYLDVENEILPDGGFDLILIGEVLEHIKNPLRLLRKAKACLNPDGQIMISTPAMEGLLTRSKGKSLCHDCGNEKHERFGFYHHELRSYFDQLDMKIVRHIYSIYFLLFL